jgi:hypothetical protein
MKRYPIECYGFRFERGSDLEVWADALHSKPAITPAERNTLEHCYDNGFLNHWDWKRLSKKPVQEPRND